MDKMNVEKYSADEVARKRRLIKKRAAMAGGVILLLLALFGLAERKIGIDFGGAGSVLQERIPMPPGGSGSWYMSVLIRT